PLCLVRYLRYYIAGRRGEKKREAAGSWNHPPLPVLADLADDDGLDVAGAGELGGNHAVTAVLDVVAAAEAGAQHDADHVATGLEIGAHALDLAAVLAHDLLPRALGHVDFVE